MAQPPATSSPVRRLVPVAALAAALFSAAFALLEGLVAPTPDALSPAVGLRLYWVGAAAAWAVLTVLAWRLVRAPIAPDGGTDRRVAVWVVMGVALLLRLWVIDATTPQLSDDMHRYVFDGRTLASGMNPYRFAPAERTDLDASMARLVERINHPTLVTIYLPTSQLCFGAIAAVSDPQRDPFGYITFRTAFVLVELAALFLVMRVLIAAGRSPWWAALYAWHPVPISEVAGSGHQDVLGIALLVACLAVLTRRRGTATAAGRSMSGAGAGALWALATGVKPVTLPLLIPLAWTMRRDLPRLAAFLGAAGLTALALLVPFHFMEGGLAGLWQTGRTFVDQWAHSGSIHTLLAGPLGHRGASWVSAGLLVGVMGVAAWRGAGPWTAALVAFFAAPLLSSTVHPWYLLWAMILLPLRFHPALWILTLTVTWNYAAWLNPDGWELPTRVAYWTYVPVYALLAWEAGRWCMHRRRGAVGPPTHPPAVRS